MKLVFSALIFCFLLSVSAFSQNEPPPQAQMFDSFEGAPCEDYLGRMDNALAYARDNPSSAIYVLIYEGKEPQYNRRTDKMELALPTYGSTEAKIRSMKKYMRYRKTPVERFSFVKAGFRENSAVEIWTVPSGAAPPRPTPTLRKMKYRKGRATGFCTDCC